jgi:hypothetical protein
MFLLIKKCSSKKETLFGFKLKTKNYLSIFISENNIFDNHLFTVERKEIKQLTTILLLLLRQIQRYIKNEAKICSHLTRSTLRMLFKIEIKF